MNLRISPTFSLGLLISFVAICGPRAQESDNTVQVAIRAAAFVSPPLVGRVTVAIIHEPGDAASEREARSIERAIAGGPRVGPMILVSRRVAAGALDQQLAGAKIAFVTSGVNYRQAAAATAPRSILSIGLDPACTRSGHCVLTVSRTPKVQITVSKAAAAAARLKFNASFLMLIKEI